MAPTLVTVGAFLWLSLAAWLVSSAVRMPFEFAPAGIDNRAFEQHMHHSAHMVYRGTSDQNDQADPEPTGSRTFRVLRKKTCKQRSG